MHLHCHLNSVLLDYGPVLGFWLFSFERYNGLLGSTVTNNRSVEMQFMRDFLKERFLMPCAGNLPTTYQEESLPVFDRWMEKRKKKTALTESSLQHYFLLSQEANLARVSWYDNTRVTVPASYRDDMLTSEEVAALQFVYHVMYPEEMSVSLVDIHVIIKKYSSIFVSAEKYGSKAECSSLRSARVLASWHDGVGHISSTSPLSPGIVDYYMCHKLIVNGVEREHYFAYVRWFRKHP